MERSYHEELKQLQDNLVLMAQKGSQNSRRAIDALLKKDVSICEKVIQSDDEIDALEVQIDHDAIRYMTLRQPVSADMRLMAVAIKISHDLERVGDEASSIAKRVSRILHAEVNGNAIPSDLISIPQSAEIALEMLQGAITAFIEKDLESCVAIIRQDKQVDSMNRSNFQGFTNMIRQEGEHTESLLELIFISKSIERIADHATNIAEEVIFLLSGNEVRHTGIKKGNTPEL